MGDSPKLSPRRSFSGGGNGRLQSLLLRVAVIIALAEFLLLIRVQMQQAEKEVIAAEESRAHPRFPYGGHVPHPMKVDTSRFTERQQAVVEAVRHAWKGYKDCAWGHDALITESEVNITVSEDPPVYRIKNFNCTYQDWGEKDPHRGENWYGKGGGGYGDEEPVVELPERSGIALTMVESLGTLWLTGEHEEFEYAANWIARHLSFDMNIEVSLFETTIRLLGGLISAYEMSGNLVLLDKAWDLGDRLLAAFGEHRADVVPKATVNLRYRNASQPTWLGNYQSLAEVTTIQLEFKKLTYWTGDDRFDDAATRVMDFVMEALQNTPHGLPSVYINRRTGSFEGRMSSITLGARGDSFYEYVAKQWVMTNRTDERLEKAYSNLRDAIATNLLIQVDDDHTFVAEAEYYDGKKKAKMDHLVCFVSGMFLLGRDSMKGKFYNRDTQAAKAIGEMCYETYRVQPTGLGPEIVKFGPAPDYKMYNGAWHYILRPEAIEAMFYLRRFTGDQAWADRAWKMFSAIERNLKKKHGYSGIRNVSTDPANTTLDFTHKQESFFLAETLKYAFLAQEDPSLSSSEQLVSFDEWVFNTEAHPMRIVDPRKDPIQFGAYDLAMKERPKKLG